MVVGTLALDGWVVVFHIATILSGVPSVDAVLRYTKCFTFCFLHIL